MTLEEMAKEARERAAHYYQTEKQFGEVTIAHAWNHEALSILSDAQDCAMEGNYVNANYFVNMAKFLMMDIQGLEHPSERHRAEATLAFQKATEGLLD